MVRQKPRRLEDQLKELRAKLNRLESPAADRAGPGRKDAVASDVSAGIRRGPAGTRARQMLRFNRSVPVGRPSPDRTVPPPEFVALTDCLQGNELQSPIGRKCFVVSQSVSELPEGAGLDERFSSALKETDSPLMRVIGQTVPLPDLRVERFLFVDIESAGLTSSPLFLIGAMYWHDTGFKVSQYLARNYAEEAAAISCFAACADGRPVLVTFNGKSFDIPYIRARGIATGAAYNPSTIHLDVLHLSRRFWKGRLPNCKLQTLEAAICGRPRQEDIPGAEIPDAYHAFVRSGNAWQLTDIMRHNMLDLVTLADIMTRFPKGI